jgi:predicted lipoprotein with Yx(FWY)xxD motif
MKQSFGIVVSTLCLAVLAACSTTPTAESKSTAPVPNAKASTPAKMVNIPANIPFVADAGKLKTKDGYQTYFYKKDGVDTIHCVRDCMVGFTPVFATGEDKAVGDFKIFERPEGFTQWSYKGHPIYIHPKIKNAKQAAASDKSFKKAVDSGNWEEGAL